MVPVRKHLLKRGRFIFVVTFPLLAATARQPTTAPRWPIFHVHVATCNDRKHRKGSKWLFNIIMVNEFKLAVVHFACPNPMQTCACAWINRWTKNYGKSGLGHRAAGPPGHSGPRAAGPLWAAGQWAFGPPGRWAVAGLGPLRALGRGLFLAKPCWQHSDI